MKKIPFHIVDVEVSKLYDKKFDHSDTKGIEDHCEFIASFIESCGYTIEEYFRISMGFDKIDAN